MIIKINHDDHDDDGIDLILRALGKGYYARKGLLMLASIYTQYFWPPKKAVSLNMIFLRIGKDMRKGFWLFWLLSSVRLF